MTTWHVRVDWACPTLSEAECLQVLEPISDLRPALDVVDEDQGDYNVTVHLEAATLRKAIAEALQRVEAAISHLGVKAEGVEAITSEEVERRLERPSLPQLVGHAEVAELLGVSRQRAAQLADRADFPPAVMQIKAGPLRVRDQVEDWAATWSRKSGRPAKAAAPEANSPSS